MATDVLEQVHDCLGVFRQVALVHATATREVRAVVARAVAINWIEVLSEVVEDNLAPTINLIHGKGADAVNIIKLNLDLIAAAAAAATARPTIPLTTGDAFACHHLEDGFVAE